MPLPAHADTILVLDLSASISSDTFSRIGGTLAALSRSGGGYGSSSSRTRPTRRCRRARRRPISLRSFATSRCRRSEPGLCAGVPRQPVGSTFTAARRSPPASTSRTRSRSRRQSGRPSSSSATSTTIPATCRGSLRCCSPTAAITYRCGSSGSNASPDDVALYKRLLSPRRRRRPGADARGGAPARHDAVPVGAPRPRRRRRAASRCALPGRRGSSGAADETASARARRPLLVGARRARCSRRGRRPRVASALAAGDAAYVATPSRAAWTPHAGSAACPRRCSASGTMSQLRKALQLYVDAAKLHLRLDNAVGVEGARARAQDALEKVSRASDPQRTSQVLTLLGILAFRASAAGGAQSQVDAALVRLHRRGSRRSRRTSRPPTTSSSCCGSRPSTARGCSPDRAAASGATGHRGRRRRHAGERLLMTLSHAALRPRRPARAASARRGAARRTATPSPCAGLRSPPRAAAGELDARRRSPRRGHRPARRSPRRSLRSPDRASAVREDVQALFVLDTSRSMAASSSPTGADAPRPCCRWGGQAARSDPQVASGVLTLTDRVLPDLLPVADVRRVRRRRAARRRGSRARRRAASSIRATSFGALADIATGNDFAPAATRRIVVLLTDGESNPVQRGELAARLARTGLPVRGGALLAERRVRVRPRTARRRGPTAPILAARRRCASSPRRSAAGASTRRELGAAVAYLRSLAAERADDARRRPRSQPRDALAPYRRSARPARPARRLRPVSRASRAIRFAAAMTRAPSSGRSPRSPS